MRNSHARRRRPHLHQPLRLPVVAPRRGASARRLGRHRCADGRRPRRDHRRDQGERPARPRRRRVPDRHEVELHAQDAQARPPELPRHQRRRERAGIVQGPRDHPPRSAQAARRRAARRLRDARVGRVHLHPRRIYPRGGGAVRRSRRGLCRRAARQETRVGRGTTSTSSFTAARARTFAARKPRCSNRSRARRASRG